MVGAQAYQLKNVVSVITREAEVKDVEDTIGKINSVGAENAYSLTEPFARDEDIKL